MLRLEDREWKSFSIASIASISPGKRLTKADMLPGKMPFIGASDSCNGITEFTSNKNESEDSNVLGVNYNGSVVENFYHPYRAVFSDDVKRLHLLDYKGNQYIYLFLKTTILKQKSKYQYAYKFNEARLKRQRILLPVTSSGDPDYAFMEAYGKQLMVRKISEYEDYARKTLGEVEYKEVPSIKDMEWRPFPIGGSNCIVRISATASGIDKNKLIVDSEQQNIPYITRSEKSNGVSSFIQMKQRKNFKLNSGNSITIGLDTQTVFFQPHNFYTGQNIQVVDEGSVNKFTSFFLVLSIKKQLNLLNWGGNGATLGRLSKKKILLPATPSGEPDYAFMEQYAKNIYRKKIEDYLDYLGVVKAQLIS